MRPLTSITVAQFSISEFLEWLKSDKEMDAASPEIQDFRASAIKRSQEILFAVEDLQQEMNRLGLRTK